MNIQEKINEYITTLSKESMNMNEFMTKWNSSVYQSKLQELLVHCNTSFVEEDAVDSLQLNMKRHKLSTLQVACVAEDLDWVFELLEAGEDLHYKSSYGWTALHCACYSNTESDRDRLEIVYELIRRGANVNEVNIFGWTPLHVAVYCKRIKIAELLLKHGANPTLRTQAGKTFTSLLGEHDEFIRDYMITQLCIVEGSDAGVKQLCLNMTKDMVDMVDMERLEEAMKNVEITQEDLKFIS
jgi:hypothetical protein